MKMPREGGHVATELFYMRVGRLRFRRTWVDERAFMRGQFFLTALSAVTLLLAGFLLGLSASEYMHGASYRQQQMMDGLVVSSSSSWGLAAAGGGGGGGDDCVVVDICDCNMNTALGAVGNTTLPS